MRHTQYSNELLSCLTAGALAEMLRGDDHAPVTRGRVRAHYPLPHGLRDRALRAGEQVQDRGSKSTTCRARVRD